MIGKIIGNYKIEQKLGEGGMGAVYKGIDTMLDREVAIKALKPELASQTAIVERFRSEAVTLAKLHHPNIATLYSLFRQGDELYMVLEYVRGETLDTILQRRGAMPADEVIPVFCQILDGINHAHEFGIIHRDIKPCNMMLTERGILKVLDFGIARLLGSARMTRSGNIIGTLEYMAPEQVKGQETDARSDIYALGMMLYEVLTGKTPFDTENEFELMKLQTESMPIPPSKINPSIPKEVEAAIMRAIAKDPNERFQTAGEFRETLLEAGFAASGLMRTATTGNHKSQIDTTPKAPVSQHETEKINVLEDAVKENHQTDPAAIPLSTNEIKETRLARSDVQATAPVQMMKETRLGVSDFSNAETGRTIAEPSNSFLSSLTWVHYAVAGFAATLLLGLLILVPLYIFSGDKQKINAEKVKPADKPVVIETKDQKLNAPTPEPPTVIRQSVVTDNNPPLAVETPTYVTPQPTTPDETLTQPSKLDPKKPENPAPKQEAPSKRETVAQKTPKPAPPPQAAKKTDPGREERLRRILTDH